MKGIIKILIAYVAMALSSFTAHASFISVDARSAIRFCSGTFEDNAFAEFDGAISMLVQANSSGCGGNAASAFAEADLGARTVRTFNTSTVGGTSDAYAELVDRYFFTGVPDEVDRLRLGLSVSFFGGVVTDGHNFNSGLLLGQAGQFSLRVSLTDGGSFESGGIQTFHRLIGGGFSRIDISLLIDSIQLFGAGTVDFSGTGAVNFDLSLLPAGVGLVSESGFSIINPNTVPEPGSMLLLGFSLAGLALVGRRKKLMRSE